MAKPFPEIRVRARARIDARKAELEAALSRDDLDKDLRREYEAQARIVGLLPSPDKILSERLKNAKLEWNPAQKERFSRQTDPVYIEFKSYYDQAVVRLPNFRQQLRDDIADVQSYNRDIERILAIVNTPAGRFRSRNLEELRNLRNTVLEREGRIQYTQPPLSVTEAFRLANILHAKYPTYPEIVTARADFGDTLTRDMVDLRDDDVEALAARADFYIAFENMLPLEDAFLIYLGNLANKYDTDWIRIRSFFQKIRRDIQEFSDNLDRQESILRRQELSFLLLAQASKDVGQMFEYMIENTEPVNQDYIDQIQAELVRQSDKAYQDTKDDIILEANSADVATEALQRAKIEKIQTTYGRIKNIAPKLRQLWGNAGLLYDRAQTYNRRRNALEREVAVETNTLSDQEKQKLQKMVEAQLAHLRRSIEFRFDGCYRLFEDLIKYRDYLMRTEENFRNVDDRRTVFRQQVRNWLVNEPSSIFAYFENEEIDRVRLLDKFKNWVASENEYLLILLLAQKLGIYSADVISAMIAAQEERIARSRAFKTLAEQFAAETLGIYQNAYQPTFSVNFRQVANVAKTAFDTARDELGSWMQWIRGGGMPRDEEFVQGIEREDRVIRPGRAAPALLDDGAAVYPVQFRGPVQLEEDNTEAESAGEPDGPAQPEEDNAEAGPANESDTESSTEEIVVPLLRQPPTPFLRDSVRARFWQRVRARTMSPGTTPSPGPALAEPRQPADAGLPTPAQPSGSKKGLAPTQPWQPTPEMGRTSASLETRAPLPPATFTTFLRAAVRRRLFSRHITPAE